MKKSLYISKRKYPALHQKLEEIDAAEIVKYGETKGGSTQYLLELIEHSQKNSMMQQLQEIQAKLNQLQSGATVIVPALLGTSIPNRDDDIIVS